MFLLCILIYYYLYIPAQSVTRSILKNKGRISEHGAFPLVSVQVWHREPGNMYPYNFETQTHSWSISFAKPIWANYCKKPQTADSKTVQHDSQDMLDDFGTNKGQCPVQVFFYCAWITACVVNKVLISNSTFMEQSAQHKEVKQPSMDIVRGSVQPTLLVYGARRCVN